MQVSEEINIISHILFAFSLKERKKNVIWNGELEAL